MLADGDVITDPFSQSNIFSSSLNDLFSNESHFSSFLRMFTKPPKELINRYNSLHPTKRRSSNSSIPVPNWDGISNVVFSSCYSTSVNDQMREISHQQLEIYESRIANGIDYEHLHVAQVLDRVLSEIPPGITREETRKLDNYHNEPEDQRVPMFWPERVWDLPENAMNSVDSDYLMSQIVSANIDSENAENWALPKTRQRNRQKKSIPARRSLISVPAVNQETESNDDTDWSPSHK